MWLQSVRKKRTKIVVPPPRGFFGFLWLGLRDGAGDRSCGGNEMRIKTQSAAF